MCMLTPILNSTTVCIHMNRSSMHRVIHWTPAWMTVNMMTLKQATSIITSMIPGEKMSPFASQSKAPVNMKQAISLGSWWATMLGLTVKWAAAAWWTKKVKLWDHIPFALRCKHVSFPKMMGFCGAPENYMLSFHISRPNTEIPFKKKKTIWLSHNDVKNQLSSICQEIEKDPIAFIFNKKQPQKTSNKTKHNSNCWRWHHQLLANMKSAKVAVRWGRHKSPLQQIPRWHRVGTESGEGPMNR